MADFPVSKWPPVPAYKGPMVPVAELDERQARIDAALAKLNASDQAASWEAMYDLVVEAKTALRGWTSAEPAGDAVPVEELRRAALADDKPTEPAVTEPAAEQKTQGGFPYRRHPHDLCGSNVERQSVGDPGHCEDCCSVGHVVAHPNLGCGDVACYRTHGDEPAARATAGRCRCGVRRGTEHMRNCLERCQDCGGDPDGPRRCPCGATSEHAIPERTES